MRRHIPNCITLIRILGTACLFFLTPFTLAFMTVYTISGLSDAIDGFLARKWGVISEFGSRLDSIADLMLYSVMLFKIFPTLLSRLPAFIWYIVALILIIRLSAYLTAAIRYRRFASLHTWMNKATGLMLFAVPYLIRLPLFEAYCMILCLVALMASGEELPSNVVCTLADCGYSSAREIIRKVIRDMQLPAELLYPFVKLGALIFGGFRHEEDSPMAAMGRVKIPMIFIHGDTDDFVPSEMSERLYEACEAPHKKLVKIHGAGHGLAFPTEQALYIDSLAKFQEECGF
jgi:CDP-diacylglycerol--glycerol-3-phosphate 3-phosphatidyltransferase